MADCVLGYADQEYAGDFYGLGALGSENSILPRQIMLFDSNSNGEVDLSRPITYVPAPEAVSIHGTPVLTEIGKKVFSNIDLEPKFVFISYHKLWMINMNQKFTFRNPALEVVTPSDPHDYMTLANTVSGLPIPTDGNEINVGRGNGPDGFVDAPIAFSDMLPNNGVSFWIKRRVVVQNDDEQREKPQFNITGLTDVEGEHCEP